MDGCFYGFLVLIILIGVVISIIAPAASKIRITVDIKAGYEEVFGEEIEMKNILRNRDIFPL